MRISLSKHQIDALSRIHNGCILHGGVGSGKSRTALAYYYILHGGMIRISDSLWIGMGGVCPKIGGKVSPKMVEPSDLYIITTAKKRDTLEWEDEMSAFLLSTDGDVNYYKNRVVVDSWNNIGKYKDVKDGFFIFDEQRVVGSGSWVKSFLSITSKNRWILLSATPGDTWQDYIPVFVANGFYKNRTQFKNEHIIYRPFTKFPQIDRYINTSRLIRLRDSILVDMDFERQTERHHEMIRTAFDRELYRNVMRTRWSPFKNAPIETPGEFCQTLRRIVSDTESRRQAVIDIFRKHPRLIIFYNFDYERELLKSLDYGDGVLVSEWSGHAHESVPKSDKWVYIVQYNAGAEGWNCTKTDTIIFYSESYSWKTMEQACGRIDRMNTTYTDLWYYHLTSTSTIERAIRNALKVKRQFNETRFVGKW